MLFSRMNIHRDNICLCLKATKTSRFTPVLHERAKPINCLENRKHQNKPENIKQKVHPQQTDLQNTEQHELFPRGSTTDDGKHTCSACVNMLNCQIRVHPDWQEFFDFSHETLSRVSEPKPP